MPGIKKYLLKLHGQEIDENEGKEVKVIIPILQKRPEEMDDQEKKLANGIWTRAVDKKISYWMNRKNDANVAKLKKFRNSLY